MYIIYQSAHQKYKATYILVNTEVNRWSFDSTCSKLFQRTYPFSLNDSDFQIGTKLAEVNSLKELEQNYPELLI